MSRHARRLEDSGHLVRDENGTSTDRQPPVLKATTNRVQVSYLCETCGENNQISTKSYYRL